MVFYFTGTGNSLYIAKKIAANPISIPQLIHKDNLSFEDDEIGIVCPVYGHIPPQIVQNFMKKANFKANYLYMIMTYGNRHGGAAELTNEIARNCGLYFNYINTIVMVDNFLPAFDMNEQKSIDKKVDDQIAKILEDINSRKQEIQTATEHDRQVHEAFLERTKNRSFANLYQITEDCIGCGTCVKVCPDAFIRIENQKPVWNEGRCQVCMACTHNCPRLAIKLTMPEKNPNARYRHKDISLQEIIDANNQNQER
jgi:ferredoxin